MVQFFTAADGARLAYRDEGTGLPVLCLAGPTRSMGDFDYLARLWDGIREFHAEGGTVVLDGGARLKIRQGAVR